MKKIKFKNQILIPLSIILFGVLISCEEENRFNDFNEAYINSLTVPEANFDFTIDGRVVTFNNNSTNADEYSWNFDDDNAIESTETNPSFTFSDDVASTTITLSARNIGSSLTNQFSLDLMFVKADFTIAGVTEKTVSFENNSLAAVSYLWDFGDGVGTSTEENPTYEYPDFGTYSVTLTVKDSFGNEETIINTEVVVAQPGAGTFEAQIIAGDFDTSIWGNIQNPWAVNPDNSSDYDFWDNITLETVVQALDGGTDKGSTSGTSNLTPNSLKLDRASKRAYQPINIESDVDYTITAYVKNKSAGAGDLVGTFYILPYIPENETIIVTNNIIAQEVNASATGVWDETTFEFTTTSTFSFDQDAVDNQDDDILTSVNQEWVIIYFVPDLTTAAEVNLDDVSIKTKGFD
ncbi:PKD domain-containing protein [Flavivirga aquimarina]|uniref:PKD domain-containing protein n=1 Tax=Flavivirga aquimarina TaxID=2027862 RepID=A0ABT8WB43_9FLAO|nr:PKD domain-containing protein [Flavivirga aquimarina]MDO5970349.1 PKD domain-containing protein [Flavivirga aquimarina]